MCGHHFFYKITKDIFHSLLHTLVFSVHIYLTLLHVNNLSDLFAFAYIKGVLPPCSCQVNAHKGTAILFGALHLILKGLCNIDFLLGKEKKSI